jgi:hypothetical protein
VGNEVPSRRSRLSPPPSSKDGALLFSIGLGHATVGADDLLHGIAEFGKSVRVRPQGGLESGTRKDSGVGEEVEDNDARLGKREDRGQLHLRLDLPCDRDGLASRVADRFVGLASEKPSTRAEIYAGRAIAKSDDGRYRP